MPIIPWCAPTKINIHMYWCTMTYGCIHDLVYEVLADQCLLQECAQLVLGHPPVAQLGRHGSRLDLGVTTNTGKLRCGTTLVGPCWLSFSGAAALCSLPRLMLRPQTMATNWSCCAGAFSSHWSFTAQVQVTTSMHSFARLAVLTCSVLISSLTWPRSDWKRPSSPSMCSRMPSQR
jgi:hypothetical protein